MGGEMKKKEFNMLRAIDESIVDGLQAQLRELDERVACLVLNAQADAKTIADFRRKEVEAGATLDSFILKTRRDERAMAGLRRKIKEMDSTINRLRGSYERALVEAENTRSLAIGYADEKNMMLDRAVDAETKLDAAKADVENKKAWYDMKLAGEVALRTQLEERIRELEGRA
jgi:hypothetical protein